MNNIERKHRACIYTLGCRVNQYESAAVAAELEKYGFEIASHDEICDIYIINTCAVTAESEKKSRKFIRHAVKLNPEAAVIVMGCYSQLAAADVAKIKGVNLVLGNRNKLEAARYAVDFVSLSSVDKRTEIAELENTPIENMRIYHTGKNARAFVKIEDGCDNKCAYCIIKNARGGVVSRLPEDICEEIRGLVAAGYSEVVLTGIETASYGKDLEGIGLRELVLRISAIDDVHRIRLGSLEPSVLKGTLVDTLAECEKFMPSFHLSLQSGSSRILAAMRRRYNADMAMHAIEYIKKKIPAATFTCDIIVGFPGETEADFEETKEFAKKAGFLHMHIFPFSPRRGTEAAEMAEQVPESIKARRASELAALGAELADAVYEANQNYRGTVLFETYENGVNRGHTEHMLEAELVGPDMHGKEIRVRCTELKNGKLICEAE
ncbi:MAG: tRNA (N(6)-L-threonylcarbamoyladenosine(37)-C(2))-methylthiotransferase MtaB [Eubacteriales bacterium]